MAHDPLLPTFLRVCVHVHVADEMHAVHRIMHQLWSAYAPHAPSQTDTQTHSSMLQPPDRQHVMHWSCCGLLHSPPLKTAVLLTKDELPLTATLLDSRVYRAPACRGGIMQDASCHRHTDMSQHTRALAAVSHDSGEYSRMVLH